MTDIQTWWNSVPQITKFVFGATVAVTIGANYGFVAVPWCVFDANAVVKGGQVWRAILPFFFFGGLNFGFLIHIVTLYRYSRALEEGVFDGRPADYVLFLLIGALVILPLAGLLLGAQLFSGSLLLHIVYLWSRFNPDAQLSFMFGLQFKGVYLPWVLTIFRALMGASPLGYFLGMLSGHVYYFVTSLYPAQSGTDLISTPTFLKQWFNQPVVRRAGEERRAAAGGGHQWGTGGRVLGRRDD